MESFNDEVMQAERIMSACDAVSRSLETGRAAVMVRHPLAKIGLKAVGGLEVEDGVFVGHEQSGRAWAVLVR